MARTKKIKQLTNEELRARYLGRMIRFKDALGVEYLGIMLHLSDETNMVTVDHRRTRYDIHKKQVRF